MKGQTVIYPGDMSLVTGWGGEGIRDTTTVTGLIKLIMSHICYRLAVRWCVLIRGPDTG